MKNTSWQIFNQYGSLDFYCQVEEARNSLRDSKGRLVFRQNPFRFTRSLSQGAGRLYLLKPGQPPWQFDTSVSSVMGALSGQGFPPLPYPANLQDVANREMLQRVSSVRVNLLDLYRTRYETTKMVATTIERIASSYMAIRRGQWKRASELLGITVKPAKGRRPNPPQLWLEYQYGWKPLVQDVYTLINQPFENPNILVSGTYRGVSDDVQLCPLLPLTGGSGLVQRSTTYRSYSRVRVTAISAEIQAASQMGITNPALLAWEALPYSFVVDWFYPVGDFLEQLTAFQGLSFSEYSNTVTYVQRRVYTEGYPHLAKYYEAVASPSSRTFTQRRDGKVRTESGLNLFPSVEFKNPFSTTHVANALSLLATAFKPSRA